MALVSLRQLLDHAAEHGYGLPAFNVNNMEQIQAIMRAADAVRSPVILQGSAGARSYAGEAFLRHLVEAAVESYPHIPICMHQDHGAEPAVCLRSIQSGFTSVMMDGSLMPDMKTPSEYEYNVDVTRRVVDMAHAGGLETGGGEGPQTLGIDGAVCLWGLIHEILLVSGYTQKVGCAAPTGKPTSLDGPEGNF